MGAGLLYAGLLAAWAVFLIQYVVRRHEDIDSSHSAEREAEAARVLRRRPAGDGMRSRDLTATRPTGRAAPFGGRGPHATADARGRVTSPRAAARRRRILLVLLALTVVVTGAGVGGLVPLWSAAFPVVLTLAYLATLRAAVRRTAAARRRRPVPPVHVTPTQAAPTELAPELRDDVAARGADPSVDPGQVSESDVAADAASESSAVAAAAVDPTAVSGQDVNHDVAAVARNGGWSPVPVPLPTYVKKPKAPRTSRTIDLSHPGAWSAEGFRTGSPVSDPGVAGRPASASEAGTTVSAGASPADAVPAGLQPAVQHPGLAQSGSGQSGSGQSGAGQSGAGQQPVEDDADFVTERRRAVGD